MCTIKGMIVAWGCSSVSTCLPPPLGGGKFVFNKGYEQTGEYIVADATDEQEDVSDTLHSHQPQLVLLDHDFRVLGERSRHLA